MQCAGLFFSDTVSSKLYK